MKVFMALVGMTIAWTGVQAKDILIPAGETVEIVSGDYDRVIVEGTWKASRTQNTDISVDTIHVAKGGTLDLGTVDDPLLVDFHVTVKDTAPSFMEPLGEEGDIGIVAEGTVFMHGVPKVIAGYSSLSLSKGQRQLVLHDVTGWEVGDRLWVPTTAQTDPRYSKASLWSDDPSEMREYTVAALDGNAVTLDRDLEEDVQSIPDVTRPVVINLSRSIKIKSENPDGHRGHIAFVHHMAGADVRWVEIKDLGRTQARWQRDDKGKIVKVEKIKQFTPSVIGRYPIHFHHMMAHDTPRHWEGITVDGSGISKWGLVVHQTDNAVVKDCVAYNLHGAGFICEDQNEASHFEGNIAGNITAEASLREGMSADLNNPMRGSEGSGFWLNGFSTNDNNFAINCEVGFQFPTGTFGVVAKSLWPESGRDQVMRNGVFVDIPNAVLNNSVAVSCVEGLESWRARAKGRMVVVGSQLGNNRIAVDLNKESFEMYDSLIHASDTYLQKHYSSRGIIGVDSNSAYTHTGKLKNVIIRGCQVGLMTTRNWIMEDVLLDGNYVGMYLGIKGNPDHMKTLTGVQRFHDGKFPEITNSGLADYFISLPKEGTAKRRDVLGFEIEKSEWDAVPWLSWDPVAEAWPWPFQL